MWRLAPPQLDLSGDEVHVWRVCLLQTESILGRCYDSLAEDERARSERLRFERDRQKFVVARGFLRFILSRYLATEPQRVRFDYGPEGKPMLHDQGRKRALRFNLSHAADLALYAISDRREVGIDVERVRDDVECQELARRFFSPQEAGKLDALPPERQREVFFLCWVRKEAYVKARGKGLSFPLDQFEVPLDSCESGTFVGEIRDQRSVSAWSLYNVPVESGYAAALAVEGRHCRLRFWNVF